MCVTAILLFRLAGATASMADLLVIKRCVTVGLPQQKNPWLIDSVELIEGIEFAPLRLKDWGFCRFISDRTLGAEAVAVRKMTWMRELQRLRTKATVEATISSGASLFDNALPTRSSVKKAHAEAKRVVARAQSRHGL